MGRFLTKKNKTKQLLLAIITWLYLGGFLTAAAQQKEYLQEPYVVDLKPFCPTPGDQGETGACVGFAVGYGAMSILQAIQDRWTDVQIIDKRAFSASFIYNQLNLSRVNCKRSIRVEEALQLVQEKGNCSERLFRFTNDCKDLPDERQLERALRNRIKAYEKVFDSNKNDTSIVASVRIDLVKQYLKDSIPVIVDFALYNCFKDIPKGNHLWKKHSSSYKSGHTMVVVGFDDKKRTFEVMNSWGTEWANKGFVKIKYEDFAKYCLGAYVILEIG